MTKLLGKETIRNTEIVFNKAIRPINLIIQCTHCTQITDVLMLKMIKAEAKRYGEENIIITFLVISS